MSACFPGSREPISPSSPSVAAPSSVAIGPQSDGDAARLQGRDRRDTVRKLQVRRRTVHHMTRLLGEQIDVGPVDMNSMDGNEAWAGRAQGMKALERAQAVAFDTL